MASDKTALGDRMKVYEAVTRTVLPPRTYTIVRVDGRCFSSFLRHADRPFDEAVMEAMDDVAGALCQDMSGAVLAFTQSDEVSVLLTDFASPGTQPWFGGVVQKMASISAATATAAFNRVYPAGNGPAMFDARVFTIPDPVEVANYFLWRQRDTVRNSIAMTAQAHFSHARLQGVSTGQMQELLWAEKGVNWNDLPAGCKRGRVTVRKVEQREITYADTRTGEVVTKSAPRSWWETRGAPRFSAQAGCWLGSVIPAHPSLSEQRPA